MDLTAFKHRARFYDSQLDRFGTVIHKIVPTTTASTVGYWGKDPPTTTATSTFMEATNVYLIYDRGFVSTFAGTWFVGKLTPHIKGETFEHLMETRSR